MDSMSPHSSTYAEYQIKFVYALHTDISYPKHTEQEVSIFPINAPVGCVYFTYSLQEILMDCSRHLFLKDIL